MVKNLFKKVGFSGVGLLLVVLSMGLAEAIPNGNYSHPEVLIQPEELKSLLDKKEPTIRVIDIRESQKYQSGHIPGAVHIWRPDIEDKKHSLPGMMAPQAQIEELMGRLGISSNNMIIISSDLYDHARLWWVLAYYGFPLNQMKLLDGGIDGWKTRGYPLEMNPPTVEKARFSFKERPSNRESLLCGLSEVKSALKDPNRIVLDVRSRKEFTGEETRAGAVRPGRIPGVVWVEWKETVVEEGPYKGYWKSAGEIKRIFSSKGVIPEKDIYIY